MSMTRISYRIFREVRDSGHSSPRIFFLRFGNNIFDLLGGVEWNLQFPV